LLACRGNFEHSKFGRVLREIRVLATQRLYAKKKHPGSGKELGAFYVFFFLLPSTIVHRDFSIGRAALRLEAVGIN
jgi:hypothetical protein